MSNPASPAEFLSACTVDPAVLELRPDYRAMLVVIDGLELASGPEPGSSADELIAAWREAYRAFGAKPQRTRNSLEALTRRAERGLPRINALTDIYNAVSVLHQVPLGGEDLHRYDGPARLVRATGAEPFDTTANGETVIEHPEPGEVVWCDETGVTCRRWNWRQGRRTGLSEQTRTALFILDALAPVDDEQLTAAADALIGACSGLGAEVRASTRLISAP